MAPERLRLTSSSDPRPASWAGIVVSGRAVKRFIYGMNDDARSWISSSDTADPDGQPFTQAFGYHSCCGRLSVDPLLTRISITCVSPRGEQVIGVKQCRS